MGTVFSVAEVQWLAIMGSCEGPQGIQELCPVVILCRETAPSSVSIDTYRTALSVVQYTL